MKSSDDSVLVHAEYRRDVDRGWQAVSRACLAVGDGSANLGRDLLMEVK